MSIVTHQVLFVNVGFTFSITFTIVLCCCPKYWFTQPPDHRLPAWPAWPKSGRIPYLPATYIHQGTGGKSEVRIHDHGGRRRKYLDSSALKVATAGFTLRRC